MRANLALWPRPLSREVEAPKAAAKAVPSEVRAVESPVRPCVDLSRPAETLKDPPEGLAARASAWLSGLAAKGKKAVVGALIGAMLASAAPAIGAPLSNGPNPEAPLSGGPRVERVLDESSTTASWSEVRSTLDGMMKLRKISEKDRSTMLAELDVLEAKGWPLKPIELPPLRLKADKPSPLFGTSTTKTSFGTLDVDMLGPLVPGGKTKLLAALRGLEKGDSLAIGWRIDPALLEGVNLKGGVNVDIPWPDMKDAGYMTKLGAVLGASVLFAGFDYVGYNLSKNDPNDLRFYRMSQVSMQSIISYALGKTFDTKTAAAFNTIWWTFGADLLYYAAAETFNPGGGWDGAGSFKLITDDQVTWAWWTPVGLLKGGKNDKPISGETILIQAGVGVAVALILLALD